MTVRIKKEGLLTDSTNKEVDFIWSVFLEPCEIASDVVVGDIFALVSRYNELEGLVSRWFPRYRSETSPELEVDRIELCRTAEIHSDHLHVCCDSNVNPVLSLSHLPVVCFDSLQITKKSKVILEGRFPLAFIDVIQSFFENYDYMHDIILTNDGLWDDFEMQYQDPLDCLLLDCSITDDFKLSNLFDLVESSQLLKNLISYVCNADIDKIHQQCNKKSSGFSTLQIAKDFKIKQPLKVSLRTTASKKVNLTSHSAANCSLEFTDVTVGQEMVSTNFSLFDILRSVYQTSKTPNKHKAVA